MSSPFSASLAFATLTLALFVTLLASFSVPVVNGQSAGLGLVQCAPAQVQVGGGSGPYTVSVLPAGADGQIASGAEPLETFPALNQSGVASWLVNVPSGTTVRLGVRDGTGAVSYSDPFTVQSGSSSDCLPAASSSAVPTSSATVSSSSSSALSSSPFSSAVPTSSATVSSSSSSALSSSPFSSASSKPESSATTEGSTSRSGSVLSSASSSLLPFSSLTGSVTTQVSSSFPSSSSTTRPLTSSSSRARTTSSTSSTIPAATTNDLSSGSSSLRPYAGQLMTWLSAALLVFTYA